MRRSQDDQETDVKDLFLPGYVFAERIGAGGQAVVYRAARGSEHDMSRGGSESEHVAVKMFHSERAQRALEAELRCLRAAQGHRNVIRLIESFDAPRAVVLELCKTDLSTLLFQRHIAESHVVDIMRGALSGLKHMHDISIVHRDVKPENIGIASDGSARLMDFGLAAFLSNKHEMSRRCGTLGYMAPEIFSKQQYGLPVDMFSFGATFYEALGRQSAFAAPHLTFAMCSARMRRYVVDFGSNFNHVGPDSRMMAVWLMHPCDSWRADAAFALTCPPFSYSFVNDSQSVPSFEAQLQEKVDRDCHPHPPAKSRDGRVRPTPLRMFEGYDAPTIEAQLQEKVDRNCHPHPPAKSREGRVRPTPPRMFEGNNAPTIVIGPKSPQADVQSSAGNPFRPGLQEKSANILDMMKCHDELLDGPPSLS